MSQQDEFLQGYLWHGCPPEVIEEEVLQWCGGTKVFVIQDSRDIIEHEATEQAVPVAAHHQSSQKTDLLPRHYSHRWRETSLSTARANPDTITESFWFRTFSQWTIQTSVNCFDSFIDTSYIIIRVILRFMNFYESSNFLLTYYINSPSLIAITYLFKL